MNNKSPVILQILPSLKSGGVERGTIEIAAAIKANGGISLVASSGGPMVAQLARAGAEHIVLPLDSKNPFTIWQNSKRLKALIAERHIDIVHARSRAPAWSAYFATRESRCKFVTTFHGTYSFHREWKRRYNAIMTKGDRVIAVSQFIADHIKKNYAIDESKLRTIPRGVDLKAFDPNHYSSGRMIELIKEWQLPEDKPLILCPGRITRLKGQHVLVQALAALPHRQFVAIILGDDNKHESYRNELEHLIVANDLAGNIRIARYTNYVIEAYTMAKMVISTSTQPEAFGRVALEAQAMCKPVIASAHGGSLETIEPTVTGFLTAPGNVEQLTNAIEHLLTMPEDELKTMGDAARQNAHRFSLEQMCDATIKTYTELLD